MITAPLTLSELEAVLQDAARRRLAKQPLLLQRFLVDMSPFAPPAKNVPIVGRLAALGSSFAGLIPAALEKRLVEIVDEWVAQQNDSDIEALPNYALSDVPTKETEIRKRSALVKEVLSIWPTIVRDLNDPRRNGLQIAKVPKGWDIRKALTWAMQRGRLTKDKARTFVKSNDDSELKSMLRQMFNI